MSYLPNPLPYIDGQKLGEYLRHNDTAKPNVKQGPPIKIPASRVRKVRRKTGAAGYKATG